eukprot:c4679_g1_i1.p1 GENE.c4679_g1_i1~~c4679_g1_i1.p1  ORF type:complete len:410 (-),score=62.89 c4679_g1_i1:77-1306(-)
MGEHSRIARFFAQHMEEDGNRSISRPLNFFCMCGIGIFVFFSFDSNQSNCSRVAVHECTLKMEECNQGSEVVDCNCMSAYVECLLEFECDQAYPAKWGELITECLDSSCSPEQCQFGRENSSPPPDDVAPVVPSTPMLDVSSSECDRCYTTLTACQSEPNSIDCYCIEDFMACTNDLNCLNDNHRDAITQDCMEEWKCSESQCKPNHSHGRICEYKGKGVLIIAGGMLFTALSLMILHILCLQHLWSSPLEETQDVGDASEGRRSMWYACLFGPCTLLLRPLKRSQFGVAGLWLGSAVFNLVFGVALCAIYLYPFVRFQRSGHLWLPTNTICSIQTALALLGASCLCFSICSAVTFCLKASRLKASGYSIVSSAHPTTLQQPHATMVAMAPLDASAHSVSTVPNSSVTE